MRLNELKKRFNSEVEVLFINPNYLSATKPAEAIAPPLGLCYIASYVRSKGVKVDLVDCTPLNISDSNLKLIINRLKPKIVCLTASTPTYTFALNCSKLIKSVNPDIKVVLGGLHATSLPDQCLKNTALDIAVIGEGEETLFDLVNEFRKDNLNLNSVKGIAYRSNGEIIRTEPRPLIENLDELPFPARDLLPMDKYRVSIKWCYRTPLATMFTARGCPFQCIFCDSHTIFGRKTRFRSAENIIAEIKELVEKFGVKEILFYDDTFTLDMNRANKICDLLIENKIDLTWCCLSRVNRVDYELLKKMKKAGCHMISYGLETGSEKMLKVINKGSTLEQAEKAIALTKKANIECNGSFVFGLPGETRETMLQTIKWVKKVNPTYAIFFRAIPFPGTDLHKYLEENKLYNKDNSWDNYLIAFTTPLYKIPSIGSEEFQKLMRRAWFEFYLRPLKILSILSKATSIYRIKGYTRALKTYINLVIFNK